MEFYEKAKTFAERKRDRAKQFHRLVRALHNRVQTRGREWEIMRLARINQLRTQEVVSPPLKYRDLFEAALNVKRDDRLEENGRVALYVYYCYKFYFTNDRNICNMRKNEVSC